MLFLIYKEIQKIKERKENKMAEEWVDMEQSLCTDTSGIHFQTQKCMQNTS